MSDYEHRKRIFVLGIICSKEGYNGECMIRDLAYKSIEDIERNCGISIDDYLDLLLKNESVSNLFQLLEQFA